MDMTNFVEKFMGIKLKVWQKNYIRVLEKLPPDIDIRIVIGKHDQIYIYMNPKELITNGTPHHSKY